MLQGPRQGEHKRRQDGREGQENHDHDNASALFALSMSLRPARDTAAHSLPIDPNERLANRAGASRHVGGLTRARDQP